MLSSHMTPQIHRCYDKLTILTLRPLVVRVIARLFFTIYEKCFFKEGFDILIINELTFKLKILHVLQLFSTLQNWTFECL